MQATNINDKGKIEKNKKVKSGQCIFPFKYKFKEHNSCFQTDKGKICATEVSKFQTLTKYGYCPRSLKIKFPSKKKSKTVKNISKNKIDINKTGKSKEIKMKQKIKKIPKTTVKLNPLNLKLINLLEQLAVIEQSKGKVFEARAYNVAAESIMAYPKNITSLDQIKNLKGIGTKIFKKFIEYLKTDTLPMLEKAKNDPVLLFHKVYGIGPKKAIELVEKNGIKSIQELREHTDLLNDKQIIGLKYYEDINKRIPRSEIDEFKKVFDICFKKVATKDDSYEIVGSYRRGAKTSGDIDLIVTNKKGDGAILEKFIDQLQKNGILSEILSKGKIKSLTIGKLPDHPTSRRIDFMFAQPKEFAFSTLYFTGSKGFNVVQRKIANEKGLTLNEHGLYQLVGTGKIKKKGQRIEEDFPTEKSIFDYLNMVYKEPTERKDGLAAILQKSKQDTPQESKQEEPQESKQEEPQESKQEEPQESKQNKKIKVKKQTLKVKVKTSNHMLKEKWKQLETDGINIVKTFTEKDICEMIRLASSVYYNQKNPLVTDNLFDILKEYGQTTYPNNPCFQEVGAPTNKKKIQSPYYLPSMDKIKPDTNAIDKYKIKYPGKKVISGKADGISVLYTTEGKTPLLITRGQATNGLDISYMIPYLKLPKEAGFAIRGELIIAKQIFQEKYSKEYKNARNMISGLVNSKQYETNKWNDIDFLAYEVINPSLIPSEQMKWLETNGIITIIYKVVDDIDNKMLSDILIKWRESYKYEIDGIIVNDDKIYPRKNENPKHAFAFKMVLGDQEAEVKIVDILWTASKDGYLKPVAQIEPVHLKGADIEFVTAFNAKFVEDNKLGVGALIKLRRSGDVIPHIEAVIQPAEKPKMPTVAWHWNETHVDAISDVVDDPTILQKNIEFFFKKLDIKGMGPGNVARLIKAGFNSVPKILAMSKEDMLEVDGFKEKTATKLYNNIHNVVNNSSLVIIASASNIFGRGLGSSIIRNILDEYPDIFQSKETDQEKIIKLALVDNVSEKRAQLFVSHISDFIKFMTESNLLNKLSEQSATQIDKTNPLYGKRIVITGPKDKTLKDKLIEKGAKISSTVNKNTFMVLIETTDVENNKTEMAKELKIPVMTFEEFRKQIL